MLSASKWKLVKARDDNLYLNSLICMPFCRIILLWVCVCMFLLTDLHAILQSEDFLLLVFQ